MIIVATTDEDVVRATNTRCNSSYWQRVLIIPSADTQNAATQSMARAISQIGVNEDLCLSAHGNNEEIGDDGSGLDDWSWSAKELARILDDALPQGWRGRILCHVCCTSVANFSAHLALALTDAGRNGIWCYGYNRGVGAAEGIPSPGQLDSNRSLQSTRS